MHRSLLFALCLLPATCFAQALPSPGRVPGEVPVSELWQEFLQRADAAAIETGLRTLDSLFDEAGEVDPAQCELHRDRLEEAIADIPISIALWYAAMECAQAHGDEADQERVLRAFAALSRHALASNPEPYALGAPIPVISEMDAWFLVASLEYEVGYAYYALETKEPRLVLHMSVWDAAESRELLLRFDALDTWRQLLIRPPAEFTPSFLMAFRRELFGQSDPEAETAPVRQARRLIETVSGSQNQVDLSARLTQLAGEGDFGAARLLYAHCIAGNEARCAEQAVDALLGFAEAGLAQPTWMLAMAYAEGRGVRRDPRAAERLLTRADRRLGGHRASLAAAQDWLMVQGQSRLPKWLVKRLTGFARQGDHAAAEMLQLAQLRSLLAGPSDARALQRLASAASAADPRVRGLYGAALVDQGDLSGLDLLRNAIAAGFGASAMALSTALDRHPEQARDADERLDAHRIAALHGQRDSSMRVAEALTEARRRGPAQQWYASAFLSGEAEAGFRAAALTAYGGEGVIGGPKEAVALLEAVLTQTSHLPARLLLAELLIDGATDLPADPARAASLLRQNIAAGDAAATRTLADAVLRGLIEAAVGESAEDLLRAQIEQGDSEAMDHLALHIRAGLIEGSMEEAKALWRRAAESGDLGAHNNLAWHLCTAIDASERDVASGLAEARRLLEFEDLPVAYLDTIWTCHGNAGERAAAIEGQSAVIAGLRAEGAGESELAYFIDKLGYFERGELFLEESRATQQAAETAGEG
jgi:TPR repeat protein